MSENGETVKRIHMGHVYVPIPTVNVFIMDPRHILILTRVLAISSFRSASALSQIM